MMKALALIWKNSGWQEKLLWLYTATMPLLSIFFLELSGKKIICADFVFVVLLISWLIKAFSGKAKIKRSGLEFFLCLMVFLFLVSFINSVNVFDSTVEMTGLIYLILLFILIINTVPTPDKLRILLYVYLITSILIALFGLISLSCVFFFGDIRTSQFLCYNTIESMAHHFPRLNSTFTSPNMLLTYLHVALLIGGILFFSENKKKLKFFISFAISIILITAVLTGSRRFTGMLLSLFIILCWYGRTKIMQILKYISFLGFLVFFMAAFITTIWVVFPIKITKDELARTIDLKANYAYSIHCLPTVVAMDMFKKHPLIGVGFGAYNTNINENVNWVWVKSSFGFEAYPKAVKSVEDKTLDFDPHSLIFGILAETGLLGLLGLFYFFFKYTVLLIKRLKNSFGFEKILSGCVLAGLAGFLLNSVTMDILSIRHFWFMLAIGIAGSTNHLWTESKKRT